MGILIFAIGILAGGLIAVIVGAIVEEDEWVGIGFIAMILGMIGMAFGGFSYEHTNTRNYQKNVRRDLVAQGWNVMDHDIHHNNDEVTLGCFNVKVKKFGKTYHLVTKRPTDLGGGYQLLTHDQSVILKKAIRVC